MAGGRTETVEHLDREEWEGCAKRLGRRVSVGGWRGREGECAYRLRTSFA